MTAKILPFKRKKKVFDVVGYAQYNLVKDNPDNIKHFIPNAEELSEETRSKIIAEILERAKQMDW